MISQIIDARPEDRRVYLEEAAGISKYKERRKETETRIRHTRENLDRLTDLRDEVGKQLQHLARQAKQAEQYTAIQAERKIRDAARSEEHTSELQSLMRTSYAVFCLKKKTKTQSHSTTTHSATTRPKRTQP